MTLKIKAWENSREKLIPLDEVTSVIRKDLKVVKLENITNNKITLDYTPLEHSERVVLSGLELTIGVEYDYTIQGMDIIFNSGVLWQAQGHVKVYYEHL